MSSLLEFDASRIEDISREPKVSRKDLPREITHTITMVPTNYLNSLWPDVRDQLARAVKRSQGRWNMEFLYASILNGNQQLWMVLALLRSSSIQKSEWLLCSFWAVTISMIGSGICWKDSRIGVKITIVLALKPRPVWAFGNG